MTETGGPCAAIEALIFDFGRVIWVPEDEEEWRAHVDRMGAELGFQTGDELWSYLYSGDAWRLAKTGHIGDDEFWRRLLAPLGIEMLDQRRAWVQRLFDASGWGHPRMRELLERVRGSYRLALLSNASDWLGTALREEFGLAQKFDVVVISALVGVAKPDPAIYELTLSRLGVPASAALFIDDQERNTRAAERLGIRSIVFRGAEALWAELSALGIL